MEYSLAKSLEGHSEILHSFPRMNSDPAADYVNPGLGQIVNLYETFVPLHGVSLHAIEKKVETSDTIEKNLNEQVKIESNQTFNRNYLSQVKIKEDKASKIFIMDERTKLKTQIHKFKW